MFRFFKKKSPPPAAPAEKPAPQPGVEHPAEGILPAPGDVAVADAQDTAPYADPATRIEPSLPDGAIPPPADPIASQDAVDVGATHFEPVIPPLDTPPVQPVALAGTAPTVPSSAPAAAAPAAPATPAAPAASATPAAPGLGPSSSTAAAGAAAGSYASQPAIVPQQVTVDVPPVEPAPAVIASDAPAAAAASPSMTPSGTPVDRPVILPANTPAATPSSSAAPVALAPSVPDRITPIVGTVPAVASTPAGDTPAPAEKKASWLTRLKRGLSRTGQSIGGIFVGVSVDENLFEELESALIMADAGVEATQKLITALRARVKKERIEDAEGVKRALCDVLTDHLKPLERPFDLTRAKPLVVMIAGVNGAGKTTSIGKLAHTFQRQGASVLLAAGDTFRAAAREQLVAWGARNNVSVIAQDKGDPAAVAFDAVNAGRARGMGVVMVDTAGRLPTQLHLMEEIKKIRRVIAKADPAAPHEVLLVIDGNTGQNAIAQIRAFDAALNLTGLVVTKLDGTAKGGTLAAVAAGSQGVRPVPVYWIGVGEGMEDLQPFVAREFAQAVLGLS